MEKFTFADARTLGSIARINQADRIARNDSKLMDNIKTMPTAQMLLYMKEWIHGFDEMALEYAMAAFNFETLFDKE